MSGSFEISLGIVLFDNEKRVEKGRQVRGDFATFEFTPNLDFVSAIKTFSKAKESSTTVFLKILEEHCPGNNIEELIHDAISQSFPDGDEGIEELSSLSEGLVSSKTSNLCKTLGIEKKDFYEILFEYNNDYELGDTQAGMWLDEIPDADDYDPEEYRAELENMYFPPIEIEALLSINMNTDTEMVEQEINQFCSTPISSEISTLLGDIIEEIKNYLF